jgi:hypothetical protein
LDQSGELCSPVGNSTTEYQNLTLLVYPDGQFETLVSFSPNSEPLAVAVDVSAKDGTVTISLPALPKDQYLTVSDKEPETITINEKCLVKLNGLEDLSSHSGWIWDAQKKVSKIHLSSQAQPTKVVIH